MRKTYIHTWWEKWTFLMLMEVVGVVTVLEG